MIAIQMASICATFNLVVSKIDLVKKLYYLWNNQVNSGDAHNTFLESTILKQTASTPRLWTGQLEKQGRRNERGMETEMGKEFAQKAACTETTQDSRYHYK